MKLFDTTLASLQHAMDARLEKQVLLAGNLANANTPGYVPRDLDFGAAMAEAERAIAQPVALLVTHEGHIPVASAAGPRAGGHVLEQTGAHAGLDGNKVDVDRAMAALAENALQYGASARAAGKKLAILRAVITDGAA